MRTHLVLAALLILGAAGSLETLQAQKAPKITETVTFAPDWESAVAEAKMLNLPLVVHSHGFY